MKTLGLASLFMPESFLLPLLVLAGLFLTIGLRKLAGSLVALVLVVAFSPMFEPLFDELFERMPWWVSPLFIAGLVLLFAGRFLRDVLVHAIGELLARAIGAVLTSRIGLAAFAAAIAGMWSWLR